VPAGTVLLRGKQKIFFHKKAICYQNIKRFTKQHAQESVSKKIIIPILYPTDKQTREFKPYKNKRNL